METESESRLGARAFLLLVCLLLTGGSGAWAKSACYLSPTALTASADGTTLFVACATTNRVLCVDTALGKVRNSINLPSPASGLALSPDGARLFVTCPAPESQVCVVDVAHRKIISTLAAGHTALSPVASRDGKALYVCNQFNNDVSVIDLATGRETARIPVQREPVSADITLDGKYLLVANHLSTGRSDLKYVAAVVSVIDLTAGKVVKELQLPSGSEMLKGLRVSPDGKYAVLTHIFCNYDLATTRLDLGLMNANALTIIDLSNLDLLFTLLLDEPYHGAANPWGVAWSADSATLAVTHAGTHEISVIDFPALIAGLPADKKEAWHTIGTTAVLKYVPHYEDDELNDGLPFLVGARERVKLPASDLGPRAVAIVGHKIYSANYFSDTLSAIDLTTPTRQPVSLALGRKLEMTGARKGEFYFHDGDICHDGWQSCASCHPGDGRADALNWDLVTDGIGNPRNTRSIVLADRTPAAMSLGTNAEAAVRTGIKMLLFTNLPEDIAVSMDQYVKSLKPVPSPYLEHGHLSAAALRGKTLFTRAGCIDCHVPGLYTDLRSHDVGTGAPYDGKSPRFYPPTLIEAWRTAPYLHNGSAATIRDVLTTCNPKDGRHGDVAHLTDQEIDDLCMFVLSL